MRFWLVLGLIVTISPFAHAQDSSDSTQVYDVRDLVEAYLAIENPPAEANDAFERPTPTPLPNSLKDSWAVSPLMGHIVQSVHDGGGKISFLVTSYQMVVTASAAQQAALAASLDNIRREHLKCLTIETRLLQVNSNAWANMDPALNELLFNQAGSPWPCVLDSAHEGLLERTIVDKSGITSTKWPRITLPLNVRGSITMGTDIYYVNDFVPGHDHAHISFLPMTAYVFSGLSTIIRPNASADGSLIGVIE